MNFQQVLGRPVTDLVDIAAGALQQSNSNYTRDYLMRNGGVYVSQEPYYSTGFFTASSNAITQNTEVPIFQIPKGQVGQGLPSTVTTGLTYADTNVEVQDMFPDGQAFIAVAAAIDVFACNALQVNSGSTQIIRSMLSTSVASPAPAFAADSPTTEVDVKMLQSSILWRWEKIGMPQDRLGFIENFPCAGGPSGYGGAVGGTGALLAAGGTVASGTLGGIARGVARNGGPFTVPTPFLVPIVIKPKQAIKSSLRVERAIANLSQAAGIYAVKVSLIGLRFNLASE